MIKHLLMLVLLIVLLQHKTQAQTEIKQSDTKDLSSENWVLFHQHNNITFFGKLGNCNGQDILILKVINNNPEFFEVRVSYQNGSKRIAPSILLLQARQEIEITCTGNVGSLPIYLPDGKSIRIESQTIKRK